MFLPRQIVAFNNGHDVRVDNERREFHDIVSLSGFFTRKKLNKLDSMINEVTKSIEFESGWIYDVDRFVYRSNFRYDFKKKDITFVVNEVARTDSGYSSVNFTTRERDFEKKYEKYLNRLVALQQQRDAIYQASQGLIEQKESRIIDFVREKKKIEWQQDDEFISEYTLSQAEYFVDNFGMEGIIKLVNYLNDFDNRDSKDTYNRLIRERITPDYKNNLLTWIATYSNSYNHMYNQLERARMETNHNYQAPDIEEIKLKYMTML